MVGLSCNCRIMHHRPAYWPRALIFPQLTCCAVALDERPLWLQDRMHLDCVFSILGDDTCLMLEEMMGADSPTRRLVDEWSRDEATGGYNLTRQNVEFSEFMEGEGYKIVPIKAEDQLVSAPDSHSSMPF